MQAHAQANGYFVVFVFSLEHSSSPPRQGQWFPFARHLDQTGDFRVASAAVRLWLDRDKTRGRLWISLENSMSTLFSYTEFSPQQHRYGISTPRPSTSMPKAANNAPKRPFNPSIFDPKNSHTKNPPFIPLLPPFRRALLLSAHARALPKTPSCRYRRQPRPRPLSEGKKGGGCG